MEPIEHVIEPVSDPARRVAAGGWRRAVVGVALGVVAGALVASVTSPDRARSDRTRADRRTTGGSRSGGSVG